MARFLFGASGSEVYIRANANTGALEAAGGTSLTFWTAQTGGVQHTDLTEADKTTPRSPTVQVNAQGQTGTFAGPDGVTGWWVDDGISPREFVLSFEAMQQAVPGLASEEAPGLVELATAGEMATGTSTSAVPSVKRVKDHVTDALSAATEAAAGLVELATAAEMSAGTSTSLVPSVKRVADAIAAVANGVLSIASPDAPNGLKTGAVTLAAADIPDLGQLFDGKLDKTQVGVPGGAAGLTAVTGKVPIGQLDTTETAAAGKVLRLDSGGRASAAAPAARPGGDLHAVNSAHLESRLTSTQALVHDRDITAVYTHPQNNIAPVQLGVLDFPVSAGEVWHVVIVVEYYATVTGGLKFRVRVPGTALGTTLAGTVDGKTAAGGPQPLHWGANAVNALTADLEGRGTLTAQLATAKAEFKLRVGTTGGDVGISVAQVVAEASDLKVVAGWSYGVRKFVA